MMKDSCVVVFTKSTNNLIFVYTND